MLQSSRCDDENSLWSRFHGILVDANLWFSLQQAISRCRVLLEKNNTFCTPKVKCRVMATYLLSFPQTVFADSLKRNAHQINRVRVRILHVHSLALCCIIPPFKNGTHQCRNVSSMTYRITQ